MAKIKVENTEISVVNVQNEDYISLTDMAHSQMQEHIIFRWMSLKSTIEYLGEWEKLYNLPDLRPRLVAQVRIHLTSQTDNCRRWEYIARPHRHQKATEIADADTDTQGIPLSVRPHRSTEISFAKLQVDHR